MSGFAIDVENLGKSYLIGHQRVETSPSFRDRISRSVRDSTRRFGDFLRGRPVLEGQISEEFWALRGVSFRIEAGEVVGVIGRNGAGKSTLLKLLSRITEPSEGQARICGRVASLLEVGTGFHPELTGRENIFLNGAILGMRRAEIARKFDEIVAFAEVERFLDTPIKRYSSGMHMRLAFSVAAHLEPDILIVDEVLAVGDLAFQAKCLGKMEAVAKNEGRTVLFVSHNNAAVASLTRRGLVLAQGNKVFDGPIREALNFYTQSLPRAGFRRQVDASRPQIVDVRIDEALMSRGQLRVLVQFNSPRELHPILIGAVVHTAAGAPVFGFNTQQDPDFEARPLRAGWALLDAGELPLLTGLYKLSIWFGEKNENFDVQHDVLSFDWVSPRPSPPGVSIDAIGALAIGGHWSLLADAPAL
ncbi:ABC transporter ATP-binding protein [Ahniella affigens]|uniref:ABC transporter ATP-binding protein n=1 Tax=Ahniella affigens TaxID=2021234 RepID=A0A2P1PYF8_9GAMM|nr:polysaccharide ABC transporter ATP-binding protein [Ahniella affigens]AVP99885.1 ABC transporter ATP-binding protein [Ahniella affigens]